MRCLMLPHVTIHQRHTVTIALHDMLFPHNPLIHTYIIVLKQIQQQLILLLLLLLLTLLQLHCDAFLFSVLPEETEQMQHELK